MILLLHYFHDFCHKSLKTYILHTILLLWILIYNLYISYLSCYLVIKNNIVDNIIVSDVSSNALKQGINNINKYNLTKKIDARCGNGLEVLNDSDIVNTVIISGMGSNTILKILSNKYIKNINKLVIQSNKDYELLRRNIVSSGFIIDKEEVVEDNGKLYINIIFIKGNKEYSDTIYKYGLSSMVNKEIYYNYLIDKYNKILSNVNDESIVKEVEILNSMIK